MDTIAFSPKVHKYYELQSSNVNQSMVFMVH